MSGAIGPSEFVRSARPGDLSPATHRLLRGESLDEATMVDAFEQIMTGAAHHAEMGAFLALLAARTPSVDELVGAATVMRRHVERVSSTVSVDELVDTAGTGGAPKTFNVSTAAAIIAAAAGARVAKHGNRSRTGRGSAEVLAALGVEVSAPRPLQTRALEEIGICFCFAPEHHPAARHAMPVRKALGFPTIFNLLGPLTNPAGARRQVIGVYERRFVRPVAESLRRLGVIRAVVMHSDDGLDEFSVGAPTNAVEVDSGQLKETTIDPAALGLRRASPEVLVARDLDHAAALVRGVVDGSERGPHRDMTLLAAAAALWAGGRVESLAAGLLLASDAIDSGRSARTLARLAEISQGHR